MTGPGRGVRTLAPVALLAVLASACTGTGTPQEEVVVPEDAVLLRADVPTDVGDLRMVAGNVAEGGAVVSVSDGVAPATVVEALVGQTFEVLGVSVTLVATRVGDDDREDLPDAAAWVVVEER